MLSYNELKPGMFIEYENSVSQIMEAEFLRMQQRKPVMRTKLKDIITGKIRETSFQHSDSLEEADLERAKCRFIYQSKGQYWFDEVGNPKNRFFFTPEQLGTKANFLKANTEVNSVGFKGKIFDIQIPVKMDLKIIEAPPAIKGNTATGGNKQVVLETGAKMNVPLFVNEGDIIRVNTETGEYTERVEKA